MLLFKILVDGFFCTGTFFAKNKRLIKKSCNGYIFFGNLQVMGGNRGDDDKFILKKRDKNQLEQDGLWPLFTDYVTSEDGFPMKPAPDALLALMKRNGLDPSECVMIGDREIDVQSGYNAGMDGILFDPENFYPNCHAEKHVRSMDELCSWILEK